MVIGGMTRINYFFNMSAMSLYSCGSFFNESITTAKPLSGNMTTSIQWLLQDYKNRSHFLSGSRRIELYRAKRVTHYKKLTQSCKETICRPCNAGRISTCICSWMFLQSCHVDSCNSQPMGQWSRCGSTFFSCKFESLFYMIQNKTRDQ